MSYYLLLLKLGLMVGGLVIQAVGDGTISGSRLDRLNLKEVGFRVFVTAIVLPAGRNPLDLGLFSAISVMGLAWVAASFLKGRPRTVCSFAALAALAAGAARDAWRHDGLTGVLGVGGIMALLAVVVFLLNRRRRKTVAGAAARGAG